MDEPVTPGAPEAGSEPPVEVILEEANDVIIQIISFVATAAVLLVAWSLRVQKRAKQQRQKPKKRETLPGPADKAHVSTWTPDCLGTKRAFTDALELPINFKAVPERYYSLSRTASRRQLCSTSQVNHSGAILGSF